MGWHISECGFRVMLSAEVPTVIRQHLGGDVDRFLADHDLRRDDIQRSTYPAHRGPGRGGRGARAARR